jgi:predicted metal-binding protein
MTSRLDPELFGFLKNQAVKQGATEAVLLQADQIVVEHRIPLRCRIGCVNYGKKLTCPPHVPDVHEFSKILAEYEIALLVQFTSPAFLDADISGCTYRSLLDPSMPHEIYEKSASFWKEYHEYSVTILHTMLALEKSAFLSGYPNALALSNGSCQLCTTCDPSGQCRFPHLARIPEHAVGINMQKTARNAGIELTFPVSGHPHPMAVLLIE